MRTVLGGGSVFDGSGAGPAAGDVAIEGDRIVDIGTGLDGDRRVDCTGKTLLPGLFDCHTHVIYSDVDQWRMAHTPFSYMFYEAARNLGATLDAGITTVRDASGADLGIKQAVADGLVRGPRMQISITMLSQTGGHGDGWLPCGGHLPGGFGQHHPGRPEGIVDGPAAMRGKVRELVRAGADVIKVATSGGVLSPTDDPRHAHFRADELDELVAEATAAGRYVMAHAIGNEGIKQAVRAGVRSVEHGIYLDDETIELMLERGTYLVPTLVAPQGVLDAAAAGIQLAANVVRKAEMVVEVHRRSVALAIEAGVAVAMGTDSGVVPHGRNLRELVLLAELGMTPAQALVAASRTAARLLDVADELGTLEPGKRADVVVVDGDPFELEKLPDRIEAVWQDGRQVA